MVTSERLLWSSDSEALSLEYNVIETLSTKKKIFKDVVLDFKESQLKLNAKTAEVILNAIEEFRRRKKTVNYFSSSSAGIAGIMRKQKIRQKTEGKLAEDTQKDLKKLKESAFQVVDMIKRYTAKTKSEEGDDGLRDLNINGVWTAKSKDKELLARGIAAFTVEKYFKRIIAENDPLKLASAMISVPDVFCAYNRSRGVDLLSPDDFVEALELLQGESVELRTFPSGVKVLRPRHNNSDAFFDYIQTLAIDTYAQQKNLTALVAAHHLKIPATLAKQHLFDAEQRQLLCRDEADFGLSFYPNLFASIGT